MEMGGGGIFDTLQTSGNRGQVLSIAVSPVHPLSAWSCVKKRRVFHTQKLGIISQESLWHLMKAKFAHSLHTNVRCAGKLWNLLETV